MHLPSSFSQDVLVVQVKPGSILQVEEQPSPFRVLPSSQSSFSTRPSPHLDVQAPALQLGSVRQVAEQPSKGRVLPSSQPSTPSCFLFPQTVAEHLLGVPLHCIPGSILQRSEQPSPLSVLPSSQASELATKP